MLNRFPFILMFLSVGFLVVVGFHGVNYSSSKTVSELSALPEGKSLMVSINNREPICFSDVQTGVDITNETSIVSIWFGANLENNISFIISERLQPGEYNLDKPLMQYASVRLASQNTQFSTDEFYSGKLTITSYHNVTGELEGTFSFSAVSKG